MNLLLVATESEFETTAELVGLSDRGLSSQIEGDGFIDGREQNVSR